MIIYSRRHWYIEIIAAIRLGQSALWRFGISGRLSNPVSRIGQPNNIDLGREALLVHKFFRSRHYKMDLVIINRQITDYGAEMNGMLYRMVSKLK